MNSFVSAGAFKTYIKPPITIKETSPAEPTSDMATNMASPSAEAQAADLHHLFKPSYVGALSLIAGEEPSRTLSKPPSLNTTPLLSIQHIIPESYPSEHTQELPPQQQPAPRAPRKADKCTNSTQQSVLIKQRPPSNETIQ